MSHETSTVSESVTASLSPTMHPQLSPEDIKLWLMETLGGDTTLDSLLGVTASDPRIYWYYQPSALIDGTKKAYITYAHTATPEASQAVEEPVFTLAIWALNIQAMKPVRDRLVRLLHERPHALSSGREFWATKVSERDSYQENTKFTGKQLVFRLGFSKV